MTIRPTKSDKPIHRALRLREFDYASPGVYFVTICTLERRTWFGEVAEGQVSLSLLGHLVDDTWRNLPDRFPDVHLDLFVVMPNHFHGLLELGKDAPPLPRIIGAFKSLTANAALARHEFQGKLWQRGYHDRIVRGETDLDRIREYIANNPLKWHLDEENPANRRRRVP